MISIVFLNLNRARVVSSAERDYFLDAQYHPA